MKGLLFGVHVHVEIGRAYVTSLQCKIMKISLRDAVPVVQVKAHVPWEFNSHSGCQTSQLLLIPSFHVPETDVRSLIHWLSDCGCVLLQGRAVIGKISWERLEEIFCCLIRFQNIVQKQISVFGYKWLELLEDIWTTFQIPYNIYYLQIIYNLLW